MVTVLLNLFFIMLGFLILIKGSDYLVESAVSFSSKLTGIFYLLAVSIVAFSKSSPEFFISLFGAINNSYGISLGNIVGSNIANIGLVLGIVFIFNKQELYIDDQRKQFILKGMFLFFVLVLLDYAAVDGYLNRLDGLIFLILFIKSIIIIKFVDEKSLSTTITTLLSLFGKSNNGINRINVPNKPR